VVSQARLLLSGPLQRLVFYGWRGEFAHNTGSENQPLLARGGNNISIEIRRQEFFAVFIASARRFSGTQGSADFSGTRI
jgi:hypothetical protein